MTLYDVCRRIAPSSDPAELDRWAAAGLEPVEILNAILSVPARGSAVTKVVMEWCTRRLLPDLPAGIQASTAAVLALVHWLEGHTPAAAAAVIRAAHARAGVPAPPWLDAVSAT